MKCQPVRLPSLSLTDRPATEGVHAPKGFKDCGHLLNLLSHYRRRHDYLKVLLNPIVDVHYCSDISNCERY